MPVFFICIVFSLSFYLYYKMKYFRSQRPMERQCISGKSSIALGSFVFFFGLNQIFIFPYIFTYIVDGILMLVGFGSMWAGYKAYKHYLTRCASCFSPFSIKNAQNLLNIA